MKAMALLIMTEMMLISTSKRATAYIRLIYAE